MFTPNCQEGTPEFLRLLLERLPDKLSGLPLLFRLDSGNDSIDTIKALFNDANAKSRFLVLKRNARRESGEGWLEYAQAYGKAKQVRAGKLVWTGHAYDIHPDGFNKIH